MEAPPLPAHSAGLQTPAAHATLAHAIATPTHATLRDAHKPRDSSRSDTTSGLLKRLPSMEMNSGFTVGSSTSRGSSSSVGGGREGRLPLALGTVPPSAISSAQWATRSHSSGRDLSESLGLRRKLTLSESESQGFQPRSTSNESLGFQRSSTLSESLGFQRRSTSSESLGFQGRSTLNEFQGRSTSNDSLGFQETSTLNESLGFQRRSALNESLGLQQRSTLSESSASTPMRQTSKTHLFTTSSSSQRGALDSSRNSYIISPRTPSVTAGQRRGSHLVADSRGQFPLRTPLQGVEDSTVFPSTSLNGQRSTDSSSSSRRRKRAAPGTALGHEGATARSSSSTSSMPTTPLPAAAHHHPPAAHHDLTHDDLGAHDPSEDDDASQIVMSLSWSQGKLGAAFYDFSSSQVYVLEDKVEAAPDFWVLRTLFREQLPRWMLVGGRQDERLFTVLRELCGVPPTPLCQGATPTTAQGQQEGGGGGTREPRTPASNTTPTSLSAPSSAASCTIRVLPVSDFKYELCVRRVLSLSLPGEPEGVTETERELYVRGKVNTDLVSMTRALGALLRFLDKHGLELLPPTVLMEGTPILGIHVYVMEELAQLDDATAAALQLFSEDQHPAAFKSGKSSASKEGLSLYALLSRTSCPMAAHTLRRVLLRPVVDREVLEARYDAVGWGVNPANLDTLRQLQSCLRHITNVPHTIGRLQRGQLSVRDWQILYKSFFNAILVGELCQAQDQEIQIFRQTGAAVTEGMYRSTFLIQRIMDMDQSEREARFVVKPGVDIELDEKKRRFNGLGEVMRQVAEVELTHLPEEVESCCIIYLPHVGYLLAFPPTPALDLTLNSLDYHLPGLEFMFKTADMVLYKSQTCLEMDRELGDIQVEIANHETRIMMRLVESLLQQTQHFLALVHHILMLDCLLAFSVVSRECGWVRPELCQEAVLEVMEARHPLYELCTPTFVANPIRSGRPSGQSITLITGPNASGKTVYLKQVGVVALLAQVGCWVPASRARLRPLDAIIAVTQSTPPVTSALSTFMLDLTRMCAALARATHNSLVIMDEFGASTYENDGAALLTACLDHWCARAIPGRAPGRNGNRREGEKGSNSSSRSRRREGEEDSNSSSRNRSRREGEEDSNSSSRNRSRREGEESSNSSSRNRRDDEEEDPVSQEAPPHVFVSTHLLQVYDHLLYPEAVRCLVLEAVEEEGTVVPLYQVTEGRAHSSYAASVASLAGVPPHIIQRARQVCECIRGGRLPPRWSLLEDESERLRCEGVVNLLLSHDLSREPVHLLLEKIRRYDHVPTSPTRSPAASQTTSGPGIFRTPLGTPRRSRRKRRREEEEDSRRSSSLEAERVLEEESTGTSPPPPQSCVEVIMSSGASSCGASPQVTPRNTPQVTPQVTPRNTPQVTPRNTPQVTPQVTPRNTPQVTPGNTPQVTPEKTPQVTPRNTPQVTPGNTPQITTGNTPQVTPGNTPQVTPQVAQSNTLQVIPANTPQVTQRNTLQVTPGNTPLVTLKDTPQVTAQTTPLVSSQDTSQFSSQDTSQFSSQDTPQVSSLDTPHSIIRATPQTTTPQNTQHSEPLATRQDKTPQSTSPALLGWTCQLPAARPTSHTTPKAIPRAISLTEPHPTPATPRAMSLKEPHPTPATPRAMSLKEPHPTPATPRALSLKEPHTIPRAISLTEPHPTPATPRALSLKEPHTTPRAISLTEPHPTPATPKAAPRVMPLTEPHPTPATPKAAPRVMPLTEPHPTPATPKAAPRVMPLTEPYINPTIAPQKASHATLLDTPRRTALKATPSATSRPPPPQTPTVSERSSVYRQGGERTDVDGGGIHSTPPEPCSPSSSLLPPRPTPSPAVPAGPGPHQTPPEARHHTPEAGPTAHDISSSSSTRTPSSQTEPRPHVTGPCTPMVSHDTPKTEPITPTIRSGGGVTIKPITPIVLPPSWGIHRTPKNTPGTSQEPGGDSSSRGARRPITPESTLASITTGDSHPQDSLEQDSSNTSSCSQESIPLTRQYSLRAPGHSQPTRPASQPLQSSQDEFLTF